MFFTLSIGARIAWLIVFQILLMQEFQRIHCFNRIIQLPIYNFFKSTKPKLYHIKDNLNFQQDCKSFALPSVIRDKWIREGIYDPNNHLLEEDQDLDEINDNTNWKDMYPITHKSSKLKTDYSNIDFDNVRVDDPIFLDMGWPEERGAFANAFVRHMAWKRKLSDRERLQWQKWAVYQRVLNKESFEYSLEDFIFQSMLRNIDQRSHEKTINNMKKEAIVWKSVSNKFRYDEEIQINATVKAFYSALKKKNFDELRILWLPSNEANLKLPGCDRVFGHNEVDKFYRRMYKQLKYVGSISPTVVSVDVYGYIAVVKTIETIGVGDALRTARKRISKSSSNYDISDSTNKVDSKGKVLSVTILRKWNQQWRIMSHQASRFSYSTYTNNAKIYEKSKSKATLSDADILEREEIRAKLESNQQSIRDKVQKMADLTREIFATNPASYLTSSTQSEIVKGSNVVYDRSNITHLVKELGKAYFNSLSENPVITTVVVKGSNVVYDRSNITHLVEELRKAYFHSLSENPVITTVVDPKDNTMIIESLTSVKDINIDDFIDFEVSVAKQTILALRYLTKTNQMEKEIKDVLLMDIIDSIANEETSLVEISYELLVLKSIPSTVDYLTSQKGNKSKGLTRGDIKRSVIASKPLINECLEEFSHHCRTIYEKLVDEKLKLQSINYQEDEEDTEDDIDDIDIDDEEYNEFLDWKASQVKLTKSKGKTEDSKKNKSKSSSFISASALENIRKKNTKKSK